MSGSHPPSQSLVWSGSRYEGLPSGVPESCGYAFFFFFFKIYLFIYLFIICKYIVAVFRHSEEGVRSCYTWWLTTICTLS